MSAQVFWWWFFLCSVAGFNILAWTLSAAALERRQAALSPEDYDERRLQLLLSAGYVLGCAFRSALPVYDVQRFVIVDTWLSSVIVGRSVATFAELCFAAQWALLLRRISRDTGSGVGRVTSRAMVPLIAVAELCSWYSVLTTSNIGHVLEESIWAISAGLLVTSLIAIWPRASAASRPLLAAWCVAGIAYVGFMFLVDVPMYWSRWLADEASGRGYLSLMQGLLDASGRWVVAHRWQDWRSEVTWMSLYFSVAVWLSIALVHAPSVQLREARAKAAPRPAPASTSLG
jgi:hypothetical protein